MNLGIDVMDNNTKIIPSDFKDIFVEFCNYVVGDISPLRKWDKNEIQNYVKCQIENWLDHSYCVHGIINKYDWLKTEIIKLIARRKTKTEAISRITKNVIVNFAANEIIKNKGQDNPMLDLFLKKLLETRIYT